MYILSIIAVFVLFLLYCVWVVEFRFLFLPWFLDFPSLVVIFLSPIPFLMLNGLLKDFGNAVLLHMYDDPASVGYLLDPIIISIVYGMAGVLILQPLQTALKLRILEFEEKKRIEEKES